MKKKHISFRTKLEAVVAVFVIVMIIFGIGQSATLEFRSTPAQIESDGPLSFIAKDKFYFNETYGVTSQLFKGFKSGPDSVWAGGNANTEGLVLYANSASGDNGKIFIDGRDKIRYTAYTDHEFYEQTTEILKIKLVGSQAEMVAPNNLYINSTGGSVYIDGSIPGSGNTKDGYFANGKIHNSNGNNYSFTGANVITAIDDANTSGWVCLPAGSVTVTGNMHLPSNFKIYGAGRNLTMINLPANSYGFISHKTARSNITICDMSINGRGVARNCIYMDKVSDSSFYNLWLGNACYSNLAFGQTTRTWNRRNYVGNIWTTNLVKNPPIDCNQLVGVVSLWDCLIENIFCYDGGDALTAFDISRSRNCTVKNIKADNCYSGFKVAGSSAGNNRGSWNINVDGVTISSCKNADYAFGVIGNLTAINIENVHITDSEQISIDDDGTNDPAYITMNNVFINNSNKSSNSILIDNCHHVKINNFYSHKSANSGIVMQYSDNVTFNNAEIIDASYRNNFLDSRYFTFRDCNFENGYGGLYLNGCSHWKLDGCTIARHTYDGVDTDAGGCHNYSITDTTFDNNGGGGIDMEATNDHWVFLMGNFFYDDTVDLNCPTVKPATPGDYNFGYSQV